jgi:uroporphyrinogen decarboxylase
MCLLTAMTPRERYLKTMLFGKPDKIPFMPGGPRESTLKAWHEQGLPQNAAWLPYLCKKIGIEYHSYHNISPGVRFAMLPEFEQKILERKPGSLVVQDWKGNICEISDQYDPSYCGGKGGKTDFVTRKWIKCPVETEVDWELMKKRYNPDDQERFPPDFEERCRKLAERKGIVTISFSGVFWQLREWMGFENLCLALIEQPDFIKQMITFWEEYVLILLAKIFKQLVPDVILVSEDMAYKEKAMISPAMTREFILPTWRKWGELIRSAGCPIYEVDSDGFIGELIPLWIEAGFNSNDPIEVAAGNDLPAYRRRYGTKMAYHGGVDKRAMAKGGVFIKKEIERLTPAIKSGGILPGCDHGIPPDVSWPNMIEYGRLLAQVTGWL